MARKAETRAKAGTSVAAAAARKEDFARAYIANGKNGTQAAITAGYSPKTARSQAARLLAEVNIRSLIATMEQEYAERSGLSIERTLREVARLAYADPRKMFREDGSLIPIHEMDADTAATVASIEHDSIKDLEEGQTGRTTKLKVWDKNAALEKAMKHLGLFEKDNSQQRESLVLKVEMAKPVKR